MVILWQVLASRNSLSNCLELPAKNTALLHLPVTGFPDTCPVSPLLRWDEKAGLRGMRYAPNCSTCLRHTEKETGNAED